MKRRGVRGRGWRREGYERAGLEGMVGVREGCASVGLEEERVGLEEEKGCEGTGGVGMEKGKGCEGKVKWGWRVQSRRREVGTIRINLKI